MELSDAAPRNAEANGKVQKLSEGWGLYLHVTAKGSKLWRLAYRFDGKQKLLSFGAYRAVSLKAGRQRRDVARAVLGRNIEEGAEKKHADGAMHGEEPGTNQGSFVRAVVNPVSRMNGQSRVIHKPMERWNGLSGQP